MLLSVAYSVPFPSAPRQGTGSADRPICATVSAWASSKHHAALGGELRGATSQVIDARFERFFTERGVDPRRAAAWAANIADGQKLGGDATPTQVAGTSLSEYQRTAIMNTPIYGGVLNIGVGLGKTLTALGAAQAYFAREPQPRRRLWVVCPLNAYGAWKPYEAAGLFDEFQVVSMDSLHKVSQAIRDEDGGVIIFDEAHLLGGAGTRRTKAAHEARLRFHMGICLTGTLLHGGVEKSLSILDLATPGAAWFANRWSCGEYFHCLVRKELGRRTVTALAKPAGPNKEAFYQFLERRTVSMLKTSAIVRQEVALPEQDITTVEIGDCALPIEDAAVPLVRAYQEANNGALPDVMALAHLMARDGVEAKLSWLFTEMDDTPLVIFAGYVETLDAVQAALAENGITFVRVDGSVTGADRIEAVRKFQDGDVQVFLGQERAAGVSTNLIRTNVSIAMDHNWSAADYAQMLGRTCRRGQTQRCYHFDLAANAFQRQVIERLRSANDFDAGCAAYQDLRRVIPGGR